MNHAELNASLRAYFGEMNDHDSKTVSGNFQAKTWKKGSLLLKQGSLCQELYFLESGYIRIFAQYGDKEITQWISGPGSFVTEISSFLFNTKSRFHIEALSDIETRYISRKNYEQLHQCIPQWERIEKRFIASCFAQLEDRIFSHLSLTAEERYIQFFENNKSIFQHVPLQYIASMLGMSAETCSRIRTKFKA